MSLPLADRGHTATFEIISSQALRLTAAENRLQVGRCGALRSESCIHPRLSQPTCNELGRLSSSLLPITTHSKECADEERAFGTGRTHSFDCRVVLCGGDDGLGKSVGWVARASCE